MFRPAALFIGLRYTRAKKRNHFISFIALTSMLGIALGILVLITVLSVMNGFDKEINKRVFSMVPGITATTNANFISNWQEAQAIIQKNPSVIASAPFVSAEVLLTNNGIVQPALVSGIEPKEEAKISELPSKVVQGNLNDLVSGKFGIVLGQDLADHLGAVVGDKITIVTPQVSLSPGGVIPRFKRFTVSGIFKAGNGFGFDMTLAFINLQDAQKLMIMGPNVTGLHVSIKDVYAAPRIAHELNDSLGPTARMQDWTDQFGAFFHAVQLEKTMMFFILMMIVVVAVFNLVSTLVMVVNDKESDIAILRTFGATPGMIMAIFVVQGAIIGVIGTIIGAIGGVIMALNATQLVNWIERVFDVHFISSNVYFVDYLPSQLQWMDVFQISGCALLLSLLATIYPAWQASRTEPVEALRYE
jgi:lipoprotein-releasing system permease protein